MRHAMQTYNIHEAKTQLSKLVEMAARGESFVIAKAGKPMVKVIALDAPESSQMKRFGFMAGQIKVPDDFNTMGAGEIQALFEGDA
jgi:prevent-host-death family protein